MADFKDMEMLNTLFNATTAITDIVGTSIYNRTLVPKSDVSQKTINFYGGELSGGLEYYQRTATVNCRNNSEKELKTLVLAVSAVLNRELNDYDGNRYFAIVDILPTIPPIDDADVYNKPLNILLRRR